VLLENDKLPLWGVLLSIVLVVLKGEGVVVMVPFGNGAVRFSERVASLGAVVLVDVGRMMSATTPSRVVLRSPSRVLVGEAVVVVVAFVLVTVRFAPPRHA